MTAARSPTLPTASFDLKSMARPEMIACFAGAWGLAAFGSWMVCSQLSELHSYGAHTRAQVALAVALCSLVATWAGAEAAAMRQRCAARSQPPPSDTAEDREELEMLEGGGDASAVVKPRAWVVGQPSKLNEVGVQDEDTIINKVISPKAAQFSSTGPANDQGKGGAVEAVREAVASLSDRDASAGSSEALKALRACAELAVILAFAYLCDRTEVFSKGKKVYDPRQFWGLWLLICVAALFTMRKTSHEKAMPREQTDEWKGWMQIMFLMYHYFAEKEVYNAIRVYIAAYVWMTGYGNFYLYARKDAFSLRRLLHTLFRLNFLGFCMCVLLNNEYMLYYICAMHTLFTLLVMALLYVRREANASLKGSYAKLVLALLFIVLVYDGPAVIFRSIFGVLPGLRPLMAFHDPVHPEFTDELHEWHFRSGLDRFIWIVGMLCALHVDDFQSWLEKSESLPLPRRALRCSAVALCAGSVGAVWWHFVFRRNKFEYNKLHPFTSAVPIALYLLLRNSFPALRRRYLGLFGDMGKYTLETYIFQFHIWMRTTGLNGSPKHLLVWIPGYYWLNFAVVTAVYLFVSMRFFNLTATLSETLIRKEPRELAAVVACIIVGVVVCLLTAPLFVARL